MPISLELERRHQKIRETIREIEERRKEFVELEREVLKGGEII